MRILSTKLLDNSQKAQFESFGVFCILDMAAFIDTELISYQQFIRSHPEGVNKSLPLVVTSVKASEWLAANSIDCVEEVWAISEKTAEPLQNCAKQIRISKEASSEALAQEILLQNYEEINFFCGNLHRPELPQLMARQAVKLNIFEVYKTHLKPSAIDEVYDVVCFFSPSAVESFFQLNDWDENCLALAIGKTTAEALEKQKIKKILYPERAGFENMLDRLKRHLETENGISRIKE